MRSIAPFLVALGLASLASANTSRPWGSLPLGEHAVGFRLSEERDMSRSVRVGALAEQAHPRPVRVYVWYPATGSPQARPMTLGSYAALATEDVWPDEIVPGARARMTFSRRPLARSLAPDRLDALLEQPVRAYRDAAPASGPFPLVVFGQGLYYESPMSHAFLCEYLASHGFVVATCPLVGTHSPLVNLDVVDLETQLRDLEYVIARVREMPFTSPDRLGLIGFDMGGMACLVLAMRNPDVDALVGLDAGILFGHPLSIPSGIPATSPHYDPALLRVPWLHATQRAGGVEPYGYDGPFLFDTAASSERYLLLVDGVEHVDFTSYALIDDRQPMMAYWGSPAEGARAQHEAVCMRVRQFLAGYLQGDAESLRLLQTDPQEAGPGVGMTLEHRPAGPPRPTHPDFLNALLAGDVARAQEMARGVLEAYPGGPVAHEAMLNRRGYHLLSSWQLVEEALAVFELNAELHPRSVNVHDSLGEAAMLAGDTDLAIRSFKRVLELQPGNPRATQLLEQLQSEEEPF